MAIGIVVTTRNRIIVEARMNIINHPYIKVLDVWELEKRVGKKKSRKGIVNMYDNYLKADET